MNPQTADIIIANFGKYTGDTTELSTTDKLALANKIYRKVQNELPWEWLKKSVSGSITVNGTTATIPVPADFGYFANNSQTTDIAYDDPNAAPKVIFLATSTGIYTPWQIVNFSDRRQFLNMQGFAWYDAANNTITLSQVPSIADLTYEFDYIYVPADLVLTPSATAPVFPPRFHDIIAHGMAVDDMIMQLFDRTHSYATENQNAYTDLLNQMRYWNAELIVS